jgi:hypothetical protein
VAVEAARLRLVLTEDRAVVVGRGQVRHSLVEPVSPVRDLLEVQATTPPLARNPLVVEAVAEQAQSAQRALAP